MTTTLLELLGDILEGLRGPYGVTWVVTDHSIAQTGYVFETIERALSIAQQGPWVAGDLGHHVDGLCDHYPADTYRVAIAEHHLNQNHDGLTIWGNVDTEDAVVSEILTTGKRSPYSGDWVSA